jgi:hypothetical protein
MEAMQCYRLRTVPCDTADMIVTPIPFSFRLGQAAPRPFHDPNPIRLIRLIRLFFFSPEANRHAAPPVDGSIFRAELYCPPQEQTPFISILPGYF